ncbi:folate-binding protein [Microbacterium sp. cx-55]|uniref:CAF17-like 4Fe-4S cluster assembly/insertion protein YgfZ n=1 Tax=Microbacterium sp. cx-55 TaxID=2875948 RepID=UPI001CBA709C|nr:glycine cleavage T C-terminal barrel domain-containing protein [Microbacterium sp. cx-55]MBZ4488134.1 folate-binding protein [Microbacterium sp. cx-55]UGB34456.1 folate-binding protein [Microbacterium sp. cx-55]
MALDLGLVPGAVVDDGVLQHTGQPVIEQRRLVAGTAVAPRADRRVLAVAGDDRLSWLDSVSSQALTALEPGRSTELLILDPQGRVEHAAAVLDDGETTWLIVDRGDADALLAWLMRMRFRLRVAPRDASDELTVIGVTEAGLSNVTPAAPNGVPLAWRDPWPEIGPGGIGYAPVDGHPGAERRWFELLVDGDEAQRLVDAAAAGDLTLAGALAVDALRVAAWRPAWATEVDERTIPHEVDWMRTAVHFDKGCYRGQETVAKVHNLGHPPRRIVALDLDGSDDLLPRRGDVVRVGDTEVGRITSVARHHEDGPIALAVVKRSAATDGTLIVVTEGGDITASATPIVPADAGATAAIPRLTRLSRRV